MLVSNWFENNATKSVLVYTMFIAASVWAIFIFVYDESKINLFEAKVERIEAEAREIDARNMVLSTRLEYLIEENRKLNEWFEKIPSTIPYYENQITLLKTKLKLVEDQLAQTPNPTISQENKPRYYNYIKGGVATTFFDPKTNSTLGISKINYGDTAEINLTLPNGQKIKEDGIKAGETWTFNEDGKDYRLILDSIDWASQTFESSLIELSNDTDK